MRFPTLLVFLVLFSSVQPSASAAFPTGKWRGSWSSHSTGHQGPLRARIRQTGPDSYRALFSGRFAKVVPFIYPAKLQRVPGTCDCYRTIKRLPLLGDYEMTAHVSARRFYARYKSKKDSGVFDLSR